VNWSDERWIKLYTRDTGDWLFLSFDAQALFLMLLRKADRQGYVALGKKGREAVAGIIGHSTSQDRVGPALDALLSDGCVIETNGGLLIRNFEQAQNGRTSEAERQRRHRASQHVTLGHDQKRREEKRVEEKEQDHAQSGEKRPPAPPASAFVTFVRTEWPDVKKPEEIERRAIAAFPALDLLVEARKARGWEVSTPRRRKSDHGRFLWGWLGRAQDNANKQPETRSSPERPRPMPPPIPPSKSVEELEAEIWAKAQLKA
jgi:hypothetical protein